jgi:hypothetical protein
MCLCDRAFGQLPRSVHLRAGFFTRRGLGSTRRRWTPDRPACAWRISEDSTSGNRRRKGPAGTGPRSCRILARGHPTPPLRPCARRADRLRPAHEKGPDQVRRAEVGNNDQRERVMFGWLRLTAGRRSTAGIARLIHAPAAAVDFPAGQSGATCGQREQHAIGTVNEWFYGCSPR